MTDEKAKPRRGCCFYGCLSGVLLLVVVLVGALVAVGMGRRWLNERLDTKPAPLPVVQMSPEQVQQVCGRVKAFEQAIGEHHSTPPLELTVDDLNALISELPELEAAKGKVAVTALEPGLIKVQVSVPLGQVGRLNLRGRYLNGVAAIGFSLQDAQLHFTLEGLTAKGKPMPELLLRRARKAAQARDPARDFNIDPRTTAALEQIQSVAVKDGKLVITVKEGGGK
jgi:hypothetical protein